MGTRIKLKNIAQDMQMQSDEILAFLNKSTGETIMVSMNALEEAEEGKDTGRCDEYDLKTAREILKGDDFIQLPDQFEIHEYSIMEDFVLSLDDESAAEKISWAMHGSGAFRRFKDTVRYLGLEQDWFDFRDRAYRRIAREWCEFNKIEYDEEKIS